MMDRNSLGRICFAICLCVTIIAASPIQERKVDYTGHKVIRVFPLSDEQVDKVLRLAADSSYQIDLWTEPVAGGAVDFQISPDAYQEVSEILKDSGIKYEIRIHNVQRLIDQENDDILPINNMSRSRRSPEVTLDGSVLPPGVRFYQQTIIGTYATHSQTNRWLEDARALRPEIVKLYEIGVSYEGRPLKVIKIGSGTQWKPGVWIDGGIHAREWISPATASFIIFSLVDGYGRDPNITRLVDLYDWYIIPILNPDGYDYSMTWDRLYRKTRSRTWFSNRCTGVDANRNYDYMWRGHCDRNDLSRCRSADPCDNTYAGAQPFSEPETIAMANFLLRMRGHIFLYLSLHSYSQMWLTPWGFTKHKPLDFNRLLDVAMTGAASLKRRYGTEYSVGSPAVILYPSGGGSYDWAKGVAGIPFSFTLELRDRGHWGFILPRSQIIPTGEETLDAVLSTADAVWSHMTSGRAPYRLYNYNLPVSMRTRFYQRLSRRRQRN